MYVIRYRLQIGESRHYASSAIAGIRLIRDIDASGGIVLGITRTEDGARITPEQLIDLSEREIGPPDPRRFSLAGAIRRLLRSRNRPR